MLETINEKAQIYNKQTNLESLADSRYKEILATGKVLKWQEVRLYLQQKVLGLAVEAPKAHNKNQENS